MKLLRLLPAVCMLLSACKTEAPPPPTPQPPGADTTAATNVLEAGAGLLQSFAPIKQISIHMVGFHPLRDAPAEQMEAHHFCVVKNEDFKQCVIYDSDDAQANLVGVEYVISAKLFSQLEASERALWHPHNYEVTSGQLVAPRLPEPAEHALMAQMVNTYGKTWHLWATGRGTHVTHDLPVGKPYLAWSFNHDGEIAQALVDNRDRRMHIDTAAKRLARRDLAKGLAPQEGENVLTDAFN